MNFKVRLTLVALVVLGMFILHNSFWLWNLDDRVPLLFGFMPFAFSFYVGYTLLAFIAMRIIIALAWPEPPADLLQSAGDKESNEQ